MDMDKYANIIYMWLGGCVTVTVLLVISVVLFFGDIASTLNELMRVTSKEYREPSIVDCSQLRV